MQKVLEDYIRMCYDGFLQGWHERNGGNLTYRMKAEEAEDCCCLFSPDMRHFTLPVEVRRIFHHDRKRTLYEECAAGS